MLRHLQINPSILTLRFKTKFYDINLINFGNYQRFKRKED